MDRFVQLLSFKKVADRLNIELADVNVLVVVERCLPAVLVTVMGCREPYDLQVARVDDDGKVFDISKGYENAPHYANLFVERAVLEKFIAEGASGGDKVAANGKRWTEEFIAEVKAYREEFGTKATAAHFNVSAATIRQRLPGDRKKTTPFQGLIHRK